MKQKIIFLPGFTGGKRDAWIMKPMLRNKFDFYIFDYKTGLKEDLRIIAKQLQKFIDNLKLKKDEKIIIIGLSVGGIIASYYLKFLDDTKIKTATLFI